MHAASNVYFDLNPMWVSTCVLAVTYAVIISEKINRAIVALLGAAMMVVVGVMTRRKLSRASTGTPSACSPA